MRDGNGRKIDYIRISVTDRCNLRCRYCMPEEGIDLMRHEDILTYQEILKIAETGARLGIRRVKVTGGEPLVRKGVSQLIRELNAIEGMEDVTLTTNGLLLGDMAPELAEAGLSSVNVSLDTLDPERFSRITRRDRFADVMKGIESAVRSGLKVKINCAVMEHLSREDVLAFAEYSVKSGIPVRFIEMMPIGQGRKYHAMDNEELLKILSEEYGDLRESTEPRGNGPAVYYTYASGAGCIGLISAVHHKFCGSCNRVRLTSDGFLKLCLDSPAGVDLRTPLRSGVSDEELIGLMEQWIRVKPESHHFLSLEGREGELPLSDGTTEKCLNMNQIGG